MIRTFLCLALALGAMKCAFAQSPESEINNGNGSHPSVVLPAELDRVLRDYEQGWQGRDAQALAQLFTPDGFILRTGHPPVRGRDAIANAYQSAGGPLHLRALDYALSESVAYIIGAYSGAAGHPDAGKFILTLRLMTDDRWYISADMDNLNR